MIVPDANLLLYAIDGLSPFHPTSRKWLEDLLNGTEPVGFCSPVLFAFLRLSTHPRIFKQPLSILSSMAYIETWLSRPQSRQLFAGPTHLERVKTQLLAAPSNGGNLVTDAQIAALAQEHHATIHTADRDFLLFPDIKVYFPLDNS